MTLKGSFRIWSAIVNYKQAHWGLYKIMIATDKTKETFSGKWG